MYLSKQLLPMFALALLTIAGNTRADAHLPDPDGDLERLRTLGPGVLFWQGDAQISGFRNMTLINPAREISAGDNVLELPRAPADLDAVTVEAAGMRMSTGEYFTKQRVAGLLVIKDGRIVYERYGLGNDETTRWVSFSVAKSVVSMLFGAAVKDGYIKSVDESVTDYLPRLKGSSYDQSTIRNLLQMASGVVWNEDYADPESDVATATYQTLNLYEYLRHKPRNAKPGERFNYNTAETNLAGTLLRSAIGNNLSTYLTDKIWKPFGMEADAYWQLTESGGGEFGGCCINATLRDYGRLGLFALANGRLADGTEVLPASWMAESISPTKGYNGYGYFWWLTAAGAYQAMGIFGQGIYIDPARNVVIALHSARTSASKDSDWELQNALFSALADAVSGG